MSKKGASRRKHEEKGWERLTNTIGIGLKGAPKKKSEVDIDSATPEDVRQWMIVQYDKYIELEGTKKFTREWRNFGARHAGGIAEARRLRRIGEKTTPPLGSIGSRERW